MCACRPAPAGTVTVTGKTVYQNMALEDAQITIYRREGSSWKFCSDTRSGYHGTFRVHIPAGRYQLAASKTIRMGSRDIYLEGALKELVIEEPGGRIDQLLIVLKSR